MIVRKLDVYFIPLLLRTALRLDDMAKNKSQYKFTINVDMLSTCVLDHEN